MVYDKKATDALLQKLETHLAADPGFSSKETAMLHEMLNAWRGWQAMSQITKWAVVTMGLAAAALMSGGTLLAALKNWLK